MKKKALSGLKIEDGAEGTVKAVFSTFNVIDHDRDVTMPGAFEDGAKVRISAFNHASWGPGVLPVGKGTISQDDSAAYLFGQFFMDTQAGADTFQTVKALDDLGEWSYGFDVLDSEPGTKDGTDVTFLKRLKVHEVSPVLLGAGIDTRTLVAKGLLPGVVADDLPSILEALYKHDAEEVAEAIGLEFPDHVTRLTAELKVINDRVAEVRRTDKSTSDGDRELVDALQLQFDRLRSMHAESSAMTEVRKAQRSLARASLLISRSEEEGS